MDDIYFEYFSIGAVEGGNWTHHWTDNTKIPDKVRVHLVCRGRDFSTVIPLRAKGLLARADLIADIPPPGPGGSGEK
jgi:hypothetical protein